MTYDVTPYMGGGFARDARRTGRALSRVQATSQVRQATVDAEADVTLAKIDALTTATGQGLGAVARVAQAECTLAQSFPAASGRLAFIAERHMLDVSEVLDDLNAKLRRK